MSLQESMNKDFLVVICDEIHKKWQTEFERGQLTSQDLRNFWKYYVPKIFSPEPGCDCLKITYDEEMAQRVLFNTLEHFMYGGDPAQVFEMIKELDTPPALCGRVFKTGDPTYGCRDCGMDPTCVLCAECFQNSTHNKHRYKISNSSGGGYCDCGDGEAWKSDVFCDIHIKGKNAQPQSLNIFEKIPIDLVERIHFTFKTVLQYARRMLTHTNNYSLPIDLEIREWEGEPDGKVFEVEAKSLFEVKDAFVTILYNDETNTYDQVIDALMRAIDCSKRDSFTYATSIDREGRCIVRCATFNQCKRAKELMTNRSTSRSFNRPLKVQVVHTFIISHQVFASRLLSWLHNILKSGQAFRQIFNDIVTKDNCSLIKSIFESDTQMWKTARIQWHRLFISGMLMEIESKKTFARVFTKHYGQMMKDFIEDDHEHSVCVVSLAVQLFTMPTIAHMLIAEEDVLAKLLYAFLSECRNNLKDGKLSLETKTLVINTFKRIQYVLYDFKYLLSFKPDVWTTELRRGFLHGFEKLLTLLSMMQNMDPMVRQVWQHMEFEPEWEAAFNLHLKLSSILPLVIEWAASDQVVLIKSYRMLLNSLGEQTTEAMRHKYVRELLNYSVACGEYDVASAPVSLHLPLSRLVAGLSLRLEKYGLSYNSVDFNVKGKPTPEQLMEPVLRTQVMIAQVNAGMWRRNGFSLTNQIYFYHNVRCRQEMLDRDIMLLQETATLMDANEFLIHLLNRFNLINWARSNFDVTSTKGSDEDNLRQTVALAEEFLTLVLHLVSERYTVGIGCVTEEDCIKKEIIQLLCIEPMPHSVLNKALPEGVNHETGMEKVIDEVAVFKKPSADGKGYFELKEKFFSEYNFFFYHYSREEQSKSEVAQRNRKKAAGEMLCCPPPIPPKFTEAFTLLVNVMQCDIFLHLICIVLHRFGDAKSGSVTESHLHIVLHLIGYALHEEERYIKAQDPYFRFTTKAQNCFILSRMEFLSGSPRAASHKDMLRWTINRFREVSRLSVSEPVVFRQSTPEVAGSPSGSGSSVCAEKKRKADIAAERKARIMSKMSNMQKKFIQKNESLFKETPASEAVAPDMPPPSVLMDTSSLPRENMIAVGPHQTLPPYKENIYTCILCHQDDSALPSSSNDSGNTRAMVLGALVQRSTVLSRDRLNIAHILSPETHDTLLLPIDLHWGAHISSCGHVMHAKCWQRYFDDVMSRERRKPHRTRQIMSFDIEKVEYLCPLCESLCNTALPLLPTVTSPIRKNDTPLPQEVHLCPDFWLRALEHVIKESVPMKESKESSPSSSAERGAEKNLPEDDESKMVSETAVSKALSTLLKINEDSPTKADPQALLSHIRTQKKLLPKLNVRHKLPSLDLVLKDLQNSVSLPADAEGEEFRKLFVSSGERSYPEFSDLAIEMISGFSVSIYTHGLDVAPDCENPRIPQMVWASTAYTIKTLEETQRNSKRALLASLSTRLLASLVALVNFAAYIPVSLGFYEHMNTTCVRLLYSLIDSSHEEAPCLLEWDAFSMLTSLSMSIYSLFSKAEFTAAGSIQDLYILRVTFFAQVVQILLCLDENALGAEVRMECEDAPPPEDFSSMFNFTASEGDSSDGAFLLSILNCARHHLKLPPLLISPSKLLESVKQQCLPFLRCCGIFFHLLTEVTVPEELKSSVWVPESEFFCLLRYLGLESHFPNNFNVRYFDDLLKTWCSHPRIMQVFEKRRAQNSVNLWLHINRLISLPKEYSVLMNTVSQYPCHASIGDDSRTPTMCLTCGKMLCSQSYCCQMELPEGSEPMVGACTYHAHFCGASVGVFLKVRDCRILLLSGRIKGCFITPPYLDEYGEADHGLKRGNPLRLDDGSYSRLHNMWLSHSVPDVIAHTMEGSSTVLITEWFHF